MLREDEVLAVAEVADTFALRSRGLLGKKGYEGAFLLPRTRAVHTLGMQFPIDVAFLDKDHVVLDTVTMARWRFGRPRWRGRFVLEAEAGAFERWRLRPGDVLEFRPSE